MKVGDPMEVDQEHSPHGHAWTTKYLLDVTAENRKTSEHCRRLNEDIQRMESQLRHALAQNREKQAHCLELLNDKQRLDSQLSCTLVRIHEMEEYCGKLFHDN